MRFGVILLLLLSACTSNITMMKTVTLKTADGLNLQADYYERLDQPAIILLHQLDKDRKSYDEFVNELLKQEYAVLNVDLRGHGLSAGNWQSFTNEDFMSMSKDLQAAYDFLNAKRYSDVHVVGASIGANTAFNFANTMQISSAVLLSPGLMYRGIDTESTAKYYNGPPILIIASEEDVYSAQSSETIQKHLQGKAELFLRSGNKHGTFMLDEKTTAKILSFLGAN